MSTNASAYAGWEIFASAFGVGVVILGALYNLIVSQLPSRKLRTLCATLDETQSFLEDCVEEGILRECHLQAFQRRLTFLRNRTNEVRTYVHAASTWTEDLSNWAAGFTSMIQRLIDDVTKVRYNISTTSAREREERAKAEAAHHAPRDSNGESVDTQTSGSQDIVETTSSASKWQVLCWFRRRPRRLPVFDYPSLPGDSVPGIPSDDDYPEGRREARGALSHHPSPPPPPNPSLNRALHPALHINHQTGHAQRESLPPGTTPSLRSSSSRSSQHKRKLLGRLRNARGRTFIPPDPVRRKQRSRTNGAEEFILLSSTTLPPSEPLETDDGSWEDVQARPDEESARCSLGNPPFS